ncbi:MAG TPA: MiaB/RimO family radical SAM methylthiotransferase [Phycisphaerales bacterium]|nr:MiaB/RimO family radical SAM methylthiotransferase [Phycisphaerales bacterium]
MTPKKVHIKSFGCQMNKLDTALVASALAAAGWQLVERVKDADAVLINTCSVREHAEARVFSHLGHLKHIKRTKPDLIVAVIGCMAQRLGPKLLEHDAVDIVCGPADIPQIPQILELKGSGTFSTPTNHGSSLPDAPKKQTGKMYRTPLIRSGFRHDGAEASSVEYPASSIEHPVGWQPFAERRAGSIRPLPSAKAATPTQYTNDEIRAATDQALEQFETAYGVAADPVPGQAFVRAMRGCDKFCSYCIVPYVRGREQSRRPQAILEQVRRLADSGVRQITLLGQTVNSYEFKTSGRTYCLADLLAMVAEVNGIEWIRFVTSYPQRKYYREMLQAMADLDKVCHCMHMPAQSGSDRILAAMNRRYTAAEYLDMLAEARDIVPGISLAGDFIVGFPGETDADFAETAQLARAAGYHNCYVFQYSPRPGTRAEKGLQDTVSAEIKQQRNVELLAVQEQISRQLAAEFQDRTVRVLVEGLSKKPAEGLGTIGHPQLTGRTEGDWIVVFNAPATLAGQFADIRITRTSPLTLFGTCEASEARIELPFIRVF